MVEERSGLILRKNDADLNGAHKDDRELGWRQDTAELLY